MLQVDKRLQNHIRGILERLCVDALWAEFIQSTLDVISLMQDLGESG